LFDEYCLAFGGMAEAATAALPFSQDAKVVQRLVRAGGRLDACCIHFSVQAAHRTCMLRLCGDKMVRGDVVATLLATPGACSVNARDDRGRTALSWASLGANADLVKALLLSGADPASVDSEGHTALDLAIAARRECPRRTHVLGRGDYELGGGVCACGDEVPERLVGDANRQKSGRFVWARIVSASRLLSLLPARATEMRAAIALVRAKVPLLGSKRHRASSFDPVGLVETRGGDRELDGRGVDGYDRREDGERRRRARPAFERRGYRLRYPAALSSSVRSLSVISQHRAGDRLRNIGPGSRSCWCRGGPSRTRPVRSGAEGATWVACDERSQTRHPAIGGFLVCGAYKGPKVGPCRGQPRPVRPSRPVEIAKGTRARICSGLRSMGL